MSFGGNVLCLFTGCTTNLTKEMRLPSVSTYPAGRDGRWINTSMQIVNALQQVRNHIVFPHNPHLDQCFYLKSLRLCMDEDAKQPAQLIHGHIITSGFESNLHLCNKLIVLYSKAGNIINTRVKANQFTYGSVLRACANLGCLRIGIQIQGCVHKGRFAKNAFVQSALLHLHARCGEMEDSRALFDSMEEKDLVSWNAIIGGYAIQGFPDEAFRVFRSMMKEGLTPDAFTFLSILRTSSGGNDRSEITQLQGLLVRLGFESSDKIAGSLVGAFAYCGSINHAYRLHKEMTEKDLRSCTALIAGLAHHGHGVEDVFDLFKEMVLMQIGVDGILLSLMLNICANTCCLNIGKQIHAFALKYQPAFDIPLGNALMNMYGKSGEVADAKRTFEEMEEKNVISWTSLIMGYARQGHADEAITLFRKMESQGLKPNEVTLVSLIFACSHAGLTDEGKDLVTTMVRRYQLVPREEHLSCIIDLFARCGKLEEAHYLISQLGMMSSCSSWGALLGACRTYKNVSMGEVVAKHLLNIEPENSVHYVVLAAIYAEAGIWDKAWSTRKLMEERGSFKKAGYSLLSRTEKRVV